MSDHAPAKNTAPKPPRFHGWMAEFADEELMLKSARQVRDAGYTRTDAFTPFPVHGIDEALGIKPTILPFITLVCGLSGLATALVMQIWMNAYDYPYIISGKPFVSLPAFIPVTFELTILFSAFSTVIGMLALNGLFRFSNPVFTNPRFDRATDDRFFLFVNAKDKYFNREAVRELLASGSPESLDEVIEDTTPNAIPKPIWLGLVMLVCAALVPAAIVLNIRSGRSTSPRFHVFLDMDFQPKKKPQNKSTIFVDGRAARPQVLGTVARGQLEEVDPFYLGYDPAQLAANQTAGKTLVAFQDEATPGAEEAKSDVSPAADVSPADSGTATDEQPTPDDEATAEPKADPDSPPIDADDKSDAIAEDVKDSKDSIDKTRISSPATTKMEGNPENAPGTPTDSTDQAAAAADGGAAAPAAEEPQLPFLKKFPLEATDELMALGKQKFEINCVVCHGYSGYGDGLAARHAAALAQGYWVQPTSLHDTRVEEQPVGQIYYTITHGKGKMASYGAVLTPKERWAIVLYVKALERSQNAQIDDVPKEKRGSIGETQTN